MRFQSAARPAYCLIINFFFTALFFCPFILSSQPQKIKHFVQAGDTHEYHGFLYFYGDDGLGGNGLWKTDGTDTGTILFMPTASGHYAYNILTANDKLYLVNNNKIWETDGTETGTHVLVDNPNIENFWVTDGFLFFTTVVPLTAREEYIYFDVYSRNSDGKITLLKTKIKQDIFSYYYYQGYGYQAVFLHNGKLYMRDLDGTLYTSDGNGISIASTAFSNKGKMIPLGNLSAIYSDGTLSIFTGSTKYTIYEKPGVLISIYPKKIDGYIYFSVNNNVYDHKGGELWQSDGTVNGTMLVRKFDYGVKILGCVNGILVCTHEFAYGSVEVALFKDGTLTDLFSQFLGDVDTNNTLETSDYLYFNCVVSGIGGFRRFDANLKSFSKLYNEDVVARDPKLTGNKIVFFNGDLYTVSPHVTKKDQTIEFSLPYLKATTQDSLIVLNGSTSSGLPIKYELYNNNSNYITLKSDTLHFSFSNAMANSLPLIRASQPGNEHYFRADDIIRDVKVNCLDPAMTFGSIPNKEFDSSRVTIRATNKFDQPITYRHTWGRFEFQDYDPLEITLPPDKDLVLKILKPGLVTIAASISPPVNPTTQAMEQVYCSDPVYESFCVFPEKPNLKLEQKDTRTVLAATSILEDYASWSTWVYNQYVTYRWTLNDETINETSRFVELRSGVYRASIALDGCESQYSEPFVIDGLEMPTNSQVYIYPNPVKNEIFISGLEPGLNPHEIKIFDSRGMLVYARECKNTMPESVKVDQLGPGFYALKMSGSKTATFKFIKE